MTITTTARYVPVAECVADYVAAPPETTPAMRLLVKALTVARGSRVVLKDLDLTVAASGCLIVRGPNGAGKSTLLRAIAGLVRPDAGSIDLAGGAVDTDVGAQCHYLGHANGSRRSQTAVDVVRFWAAFLGGVVHQADIFDWLDRVGLAGLEAVPTGALSAGQQRRLAFARLLAAPRPVWLLDEPTVALDSRGQTMIEGLIDAHVTAGGIALVTTHVPIHLSSAQDFDLTPNPHGVA
jgi:heme exporter protein A